MTYFSDYSFEGDRRIVVDYGGEIGEAVFIPRCEKCCRFVKPDALITNPANPEATNATLFAVRQDKNDLGGILVTEKRTSDKERGLYRKYRVERMDGSSEPGGKHADCEYFVLDLNHDIHAGAALRAYANSCELDYPELAKDLRHFVQHEFSGRACSGGHGGNK